MRLLTLCVVVAAACGPAVSAASDVVVEVTKIDGSVVRGSWSPVQEVGTLALRTKIRQEQYSERDLLSARVLDSFSVPQSDTWQVTVWCADGSIVPADIRGGDDVALVLKTPFADQVTLQLSEIFAIRWNQPNAHNTQVADHLGERHPTRDTLVVRHEGRLRRLQGSVGRIDALGGSFTYRGRTLSFDADTAALLIMAGAGRSRRAPVTCELGEEYHIAGRLLRTAEDTLTVLGFGQAEIPIPIRTVQQMTFASDRLVYLSDLRPSDTEQHTVFGISWRPRFDRSVSNRPMSMNGQRYAKGIGVHATCRLTYELDEDFSALAATIGIDDHTRPEGHVVFRILAGDRERFSSGPLTGRDDPRNVVVPLDGARRLTLVVEEGEDLDIGDHANWANIRLIR